MISPNPIDFLKQLLDLVLLDGKITKEEKILVDTIARNVRQYENAVNEALEDNTLTKDEMNILLNLYNKIINEAENTAKKDNYISKDEKVILDKLIEYLKKLSINF